jgi:uncharacterized protein with PQ loop repeat
MLVPAILPLFITIRFGDAWDGGFLPLFSGIIVFFNHAFVWLIAGLIIRGILCLFYRKKGNLPVKIFTIIVFVVSFALFM